MLNVAEVFSGSGCKLSPVFAAMPKHPWEPVLLHRRNGVPYMGLAGSSRSCVLGSRMYDMIQIAGSWAAKSEHRFMVFVLLLGTTSGIGAVVISVYEAWKKDLPWFGWDLRRRRRWP